MKTFAPKSAFSIAAVCALWLAFAPHAAADPAQEVGKLIRQGQHAQALEQADRFLAGKPKDAQVRFLKGIALTEMNRQPEAIAVFQKLTEDYPELPEPYNNLAVIYAQQKQYEKSKAALEMAIRTHPSYATAHENLGDIYARLASQAYDKALQLDSSNSSAQSKLAMIRELMTGTQRTPSKPAAGKPAESEPRAAEPKPAVVAAAASPAPPPSQGTPRAEAAKPVTPPPPAAQPKAAGGDDEVARAVGQWAAAWAAKDVKVYLGAYARDFKTPGAVPRAEWEAERRARIDKPGKIEVRLDDIKVSVSGDNATARFRQNYKAGAFKATASKTLELVRRDGRWQILQERVGN